ncbi:MAG: hypothetical protein AAGG69_15270, partial [Pseudomonadota bacterium]
MCGIAGYVTGPFAGKVERHDWFDRITAMIAESAPGHEETVARRATEALFEHFDEMMSISFLRDVATQPGLRTDVSKSGEALTALGETLAAMSKAGRTELDPLVESVRDYAWQLSVEVGDHADGCANLVGEQTTDRFSALNVAIPTEYVLRAIDKLEVRGRDSAGIAVQIALPHTVMDALDDEQRAALHQRSGLLHADHLSVFVSDGNVLTFMYKTADLVGRLGDNGIALRAAISSDDLLWAVAPLAVRASVLSHTRWASHGVISVANCHPHNGSLSSDDDGKQLGAMYALNGDVDNHLELLDELLTGRQLAVDPAITTDAKIIPLTERLSEVSSSDDRLNQFRTAMRRLDGSVAIGCIDPSHPGEAYLAQKGSGQGLHAARLTDGWMFASEVYGLANAARQSCNLSRSVAGGSVIHLDGESDRPAMLTVNDGNVAKVTFEPIQIFARDIYRGKFEHFLEKEINDGPSSVANTIKGRYRREKNGFIAFDKLTTDIWLKLREAASQGISRIYVIGQGTAGVAAVGIAHLIEKALWRDSRRRIPVEAVRSSELSADIDAFQ